MNPYRVVAVPSDIARAVRNTLRSPQYGHPAYVEIPIGYGPCRHCLRTFQEGQGHRILFTYNPFEDKHVLPAPGPIFIHQEDCARYEGVGFPQDLKHLPLVFEGYTDDGWMVSREQLSSGEVETIVDQFFANPKVSYIQVRNAEAGCFIARIEMSDTSAT